ncbi:hypothetical protein GGI20_004876 [Coemansia sp. BCRC 34301]|nr:hypothetical protein GGI20_004876 [Coemansia sp. BCRC 34301]
MGNAMSFSVTRQELIRAMAFKTLNMELEPRQAADLVMVIVIMSIYFIQFLAVLYMLWNRKYPPIKSKNPVIMAGIFLASIFWFIGDLQVNGHAPLNGTQMAQCKGVGIWLHVLMGVCAVSSLIGLRSFSLYQVFCRNRPYRGPALYLSTIVTVTGLLVFGIITEALPGRISVIYNSGIDMCVYNRGYKTGLFVFVWATWIVVAILNWRIRNIKSSFNESREITITGIIVFGVLTFMTVLTYVKPYYPVNVRIRIVATALNHFCAFVAWWVVMAVPLYKCLTDREPYLKQWIFKLRQDGLQRAYHVDSGALHSQQHSSNIPAANKDLGYATANGEFFYAQKDDYVCSEMVSAQMCADAPASSAYESNNGSANNPSSSASSLVQFTQSPAPVCNIAVSNPGVPAPNKSSEVDSVYWKEMSPPQAARRPWDKLSSAVGNISGRRSFSSSSSPPAHSSHIPASANGQLYTPIINFAEPATNTPQPTSSTQGLHANDRYNRDGRQIL